MKKSTARKGNQGFTLIETLIVLAIFGFIITVVLQTIGQVKRDARNYDRKQAVLAIAAESQTYLIENKFFPEDNPGPICDFMLAYTQNAAGKLSSCSTGFVGGYPDRSCIYAEGTRYDVCVQEMHWGDHGYRGPINEITIQFGHWCVKEGNPVNSHDAAAGSVVTGEGWGQTVDGNPNVHLLLFPNRKVMSVRTVLEGGYDFCVDQGLFNVKLNP